LAPVSNDIGALAISGSQSEIGAYQYYTSTPPTTVFVTDVNTDETWADGDSNIPVTGTGFV